MNDDLFVGYRMTITCDNCNRTRYAEKLDFLTGVCYAIGCRLCKRYAKILDCYHAIGEMFLIENSRTGIKVRMERIK